MTFNRTTYRNTIDDHLPSLIDINVSSFSPPPLPFRVQQLKSTNKMDSKNLALVFTPSLMRSPYNSTSMMAVQKLPEQKKAVDLLIQHYSSLFTTN